MNCRNKYRKPVNTPGFAVSIGFFESNFILVGARMPDCSQRQKSASRMRMRYEHRHRNVQHLSQWLPLMLCKLQPNGCCEELCGTQPLFSLMSGEVSSDDTITERKVKPCTYPRAVSFLSQKYRGVWFRDPALTLFKLKELSIVHYKAKIAPSIANQRVLQRSRDCLPIARGTVTFSLVINAWGKHYGNTRSRHPSVSETRDSMASGSSFSQRNHQA